LPPGKEYGGKEDNLCLWSPRRVNHHSTSPIASGKANKRLARFIAMRFSMAFASACAILLIISGCAQQAEELPAPQAIDQSAHFALPSSDVSYFARYAVEEQGSMTKEVWRSQTDMRIDLSAQGARALSFFFVDSRAYSCNYAMPLPTCYDITASLPQASAERLLPSRKDVEGAVKVESVKIGIATGDCYEVGGALGARKICFAPGNVMAYDTYNVSRAVAHTEYLTDLEYFESGKGPDASIFTLPANPVSAPAGIQ